VKVGVVGAGALLYARSISHPVAAGSRYSFDVNDDTFEEKVVLSDKPVIVEFHANWCRPCKVLGPLIEDEVESRKGQVLLAKMDIMENSRTPEHYQVQGLPTLVALSKGKEVRRSLGFPKEGVKEFVDGVTASHK